MQTTTNLGLKKPDKNEFVDISTLNYNADVIDGTVAEKVNASGGDVSETIVETLEPFADKFPIPSAGDKIKQFFGKILTFLRNIKPLEADVTYYVATTGSDTTGDGSSGNPFKTVQHAIDILPKNLGGRDATIIVADGTYDAVNIVGFLNGVLQINSTTPGVFNYNTKLKTVNIKFCNAKISMSGIKCIGIDGEASIIINNCKYAYLEYLSITDSSLRGILAIETSFVGVYNCDITGKLYEAIRFNNTCGYIRNCTGALNATGVISSASTIRIVGSTPGATTSRLQEYGGMFIESNGTQISGIISSGLSCTWGTLSGGYVRHGNAGNGPAMVTVQFSINITVPLTKLKQYIISGFPIQAGGGIVSCTCHYPVYIEYCQIFNGEFILCPRIDVPAGTGLAFNCTYLANL